MTEKIFTIDETVEEYIMLEPVEPVYFSSVDSDLLRQELVDYLEQDYSKPYCLNLYGVEFIPRSGVGDLIPFAEQHLKERLGKPDIILADMMYTVGHDFGLDKHYNMHKSIEEFMGAGEG